MIKPIATAFLSLSLLAFPAAAQLNESCTVSVLNRTAQVDAGGFWQLDNVPANAGPVRARAVCVENGITRIGVSDWFDVPVNGLVFSSEIFFETPAPVPSKLTLTSPRLALRELGDSVQLSAVVTFPDGSAAAVPNAADGTSYTSSNPRVITVSAGGLATAVGFGTVIVSAANEGTLGLIRLAVSSGPIDTDGDGMPDDWETSNGFNPNDPADAAQDADGDGLTNVAEYQNDSDPHNVDTDGDGVRDGLEVQTGSDPADPTSYNLAQALRSIAIAPNPLNILVNSILGQTSRLINVTGTLIDNTTIDLTARSRGTSYATANPAIASPATTDGRIIAGANGNTILTVTNSGFTATAPVSVTTFTPASSGTPLALPGYGFDIARAGNHLFVATGSAGLRIVNLSSRTIVGSYPAKASSVDVIVGGNLAYLAENTAGVQIVDVSVPAAPAAAGWVDTPGNATDIAVANGYVFVADGTSGLAVIDARTPGAANIIATVPNLGDVRSVDVSGNLAAVYSRSNLNLYLIDVTNPAAPVVRGAVNTAVDARDVRFFGAFVVVGSNPAVRLFDVRNPDAPSLAQNINLGAMYDLDVVNGFVIAGDRNSGSGVGIVDVTDPFTPLGAGRVFVTGVTTAVVADAEFIYRVGATSYVEPASTTASTSTLYFLEYVRLDDSGVVAPAVRITEPLNNATVSFGSNVRVIVEAVDDVGVVAVELEVDGGPARVGSVWPYQFRVPSTATGSTMTFRARAVDSAGNSATSTAVSVQVVPDTVPPVVSIGSLPSPLTAGTTVTVNVTATDNAAVSSVRLFANDILVGTDTLAPYQFSYKVQNDVTSITFRAEATDPSNNTGTGTLTVAAKPDPVPVVAMLTPTADIIHFTGPELRARIRATDNTFIRRVELLVNGTAVASDTRTAWFLDNNTTDYELYYLVPDNLTTITVQAVAYDSLELAGFSAPVTLNLEPTSALGTVALGGLAWDVDVRADVAYVAAGAAGLKVIDVTNPSAPAIMATLDTPGDAREILVLGKYAFLAERAGTIHVIDVSTPSAPVLLSDVFTAGTLYDMALYRDRLYVGTDIGLFIVEIRNAAMPKVTKYIPNLNTPKRVPTQAVRIEGDLLIQLTDHETFSNVCFYCSKMTIHDLSVNPDEPVLRGTFGPTITHWNGELELGDYMNLAVAGGRAYAIGEDWVVAVDISNPSAPRYLGNFDVGWRRYGWHDLDVRGAVGAVAWSERDKYRVWLSDLRDPQKLSMTGSINFGPLGPYHGTAIASTHELVYTTGNSEYVADLNNVPTATGQFYVGRFDTISDTAGAAPSVSVRAAVTTAFERQTVPVLVTASDDHGVASVTLSVDGVPVGVDRVAPFEFIVTTAAGAASHSVTATATDYAGNSRTSTPVTLSVNADTIAPTIALTSPVTGESVPMAAAMLRAEASDNFSIARVEFFVNGVSVANDASAPYEHNYVFPAGATSVNVTARAYDLAGNNATSSQATATVFAPTVSSTSVSTWVGDVEINGDYAYVTAGGLRIYNIAGPAPVLVGSLPLSSTGALSVVGHHAFVGQDEPYPGQAVIVDVSNPAAPVAKGSVPAGWSLSIGAAGTRFVSGGNGDTRTYDFSNVAAPVLVRTTANTPSLTHMHVWNNLAIGRHASDTGVAAIDLNTSTSGVYGFLRPDLSLKHTPSVAGSEGRVVLAEYHHGLITADSADRFSWWTLVPSPQTDVTALHDRWVMGANRNTGLVLFDATNFRKPVQRNAFPGVATGLYIARAMAASPTHVVVAATDEVFFGGRHALWVVRYRQFTDTAAVAPSVTLTAPASGRLNRLIPLSAKAADDVGVKGVVFSVNGVDLFTDTVAPYEFNALAPASGISMTVGARAIDYGGNSSAVGSATVTLTP
jgi:hypothetical protein